MRPSGATAFDVVTGSLDTLRATGGNFTIATQSCAAAKTSAASLTVPFGSGTNEWYIVRAANCGGPGSYDSGGATQSGSRDAEIAASPYACP